MSAATLTAPTDDLLRARLADDAPLAEVREAGDGRQHLVGHFAVFNQWTEINSWEGRFLERLAPGSARKTIVESRQSVKVLYDHGHDPTVGNKPLGPIESLEEDARGVRYDVALIDTDYNRDFIIPALRDGLLGASFRFSVVKESWVEPERATRHNPNKLPERTINEFRLFEFGPVTFPAYEAATAGLRSAADFDLWQRLDERGRAQLLDLFRQAHGLGTPGDGAAREGTPIVEPPADNGTEPDPHATPATTKTARLRAVAKVLEDIR